MKARPSVLILLLFLAGPAGAADGNGDDKSRTQVPEEEDFSSTPFTQYGEFNEEEEEEADTKFLQHGRLFGVSLGVGYEGVTGNRGLVWQGGFPLIDFKLHYWFDFQVALNLGVTSGSHFFTGGPNPGTTDANLTRVGLDIVYYFDVKNLAAPISFANPHISVGGGAFTKTQTSSTSGGTPDSNVGIGLTLGAGLEFAVRPRKVYLALEGRYSIARFEDTFSGQFLSSHGVQDLTGDFFSFHTSIIFNW